MNRSPKKKAFNSCRNWNVACGVRICETAFGLPKRILEVQVQEICINFRYKFAAGEYKTFGRMITEPLSIFTTKIDAHSVTQCARINIFTGPTNQ